MLTSANCAFQCNEYRLRYQSITFYTGGKTKLTFRSYIHPFFDPIAYKYDVALIQVPSKTFKGIFKWQMFKENKMKHWNVENTPVIVSGWGTMCDSSASSVLQFVSGKMFNSIEKNGKQHLMYVEFDENANACFYDNGSPLMATVNGQFWQIGIATSLSEKNNLYGLFTSLLSDSIYNFITKTAKIDSI